MSKTGTARLNYNQGYAEGYQQAMAEILDALNCGGEDEALIWINNNYDREQVPMEQVPMEQVPMEQVELALNKAANDIRDEADLPDEGVIDALNLMVNAVAAYLKGEAETLEQVVEQGYETATLDEVIVWINRGN
jgi:hypothetical protein